MKLNYEVEASRACEAFFASYSKEFLKYEEAWGEVVTDLRSQKEKVKLREILELAVSLKRLAFEDYNENAKRFVWVYFKNKPFDFDSELVSYCQRYVLECVYFRLEEILC